MTDSIGTIGSTSTSLLMRLNDRDRNAWGQVVKLSGPLVNLWLRKPKLRPADDVDVRFFFWR